MTGNTAETQNNGSLENSEPNSFNETFNEVEATANKNNIENIANSQSPNYDAKLDLLLDIGVNVSIELGCKTIKLKELLALNKNSLIELDRSAGDSLDVKANGSLVARGEVVTMNGKYGIRLTEVVNKSKRIENI